MRRRSGFNPKRRICAVGTYSPQQLNNLASKALYTGNPEHKQRPGDYGMTPPSSPRPGKTLCDAAGDFSKALAEKLLRNGLIRGLVSHQDRNGWPQNVWAVEDGVAFEAQLENETAGAYHGYPMPDNDEFRNGVMENWKAREPETDH
jgi:hypothetical protein